MSELRLDSATHFNVSLQLLSAEVWAESIVLKSVHVDNVFGNCEILFVVLFIEDHKEQIESTHDRR